MSASPRAAIFDMDGLLVDSEPLWHLAEVEILGELGVPLDRDGTRGTKGMFVTEVVDHWHQRFPWSEPSQPAVVEQILDRVGELTIERGVVLPGALDTVVAMAARGPVALASSTPRRLIDVILAHIGLSDSFDAVCSAEDEDWGKPHPAVFLTAASAIGVVPQRCVVFEDSPAGVLAAKAGRMVCVAVPEASERDRSEMAIADIVLDSLVDLDHVELDALLGD
jgi:sugar-phosphatase